ncbi:hypothetical protein BJV78DRAFT_547753 [Lactifluus subvellereus]|nr:hypothetical protein BJV78DRAFT_547753 [Lactifluus subvellereus]
MPSLAKVYFAAILFSAVFLGAYAILMVTALYLLSRKEKTVTTIIMMILTVVMFCLSVTFFSMDVYSISNGLFNPQKYPHTFISFWGPESTTHILCQGINSVLGDSIVIWRAWVVWDRRLPVVLVPIILLAGVGRTIWIFYSPRKFSADPSPSTVSSFIMASAQRHGPSNPDWVAVFMKSMIVLPCLTLATNVASTTLVLWRVYALNSTMRKVERLEANPNVPPAAYRSVQYHRLLKIIIESGALYCITWTLLLGFIASGSPVSHVVLSVVGQLTGIYPTLIIVLVSLNLTHDHVQGQADSRIKFDGNTIPMTTFTRTISFSAAHNSYGLGSSSGGSNSGAGPMIATGGGEECVVDIRDCPSDPELTDPELKEYGMHRVI